MLKHTLFIAGLTIGSLSVVNQSAHALSWHWAYIDDQGGLAQGTFTTGGASYNSADVYTISAIAGTYTPSGGSAETITGLSSVVWPQVDQTFKWDGTNTSTILLNNNGFEYVTNRNSDFNIYKSGAGNTTAGPYLAAGTWANGSGGGGYVTSSTLTPAASTPVPFEFSPEQGVILGIPLFLGLRKLKSKNAIQKQNQTLYLVLVLNARTNTKKVKKPAR